MTAAARADPPALSGVQPRGFTRGQPVEITVTGERLYGATGALCRIPGVPGALAPVDDPQVKVEVLDTQPKSARLRLMASAQADPGLRELRLVTPYGISNPRPIVVGAFPEAAETEPNNPPAAPQRLPALPLTLVGRVQPADETDRFTFSALAGQHLVFDVDAVSVGATLDPILTLRDAAGRALAINDDTDGRDPWLAHRFERPGDYTIEIRDTSYRAGPDATYRLTVGALPHVTGIFPLGGKRGMTLSVGVDGINLPTATVPFAADAGDVRELRVDLGPAGVARRAFAVDDLFDATEREPNNGLDRANEVITPVAINGRADRPGDIDTFKFLAQGKTRLVFELFAQRLGSSYDPYLSIVDGSGKELGSNDDGPEGRDSYREVTFPITTDFYVRVRNLMTDESGPSCAYRLVIRPPTPDFDLGRNLEPVSLRRGGAVEVTIPVARQDGWQGPVNLLLVTPPELFGVRAAPVTVAGSAKEGRLRITAAPNASVGHFTVQIRAEGTPGNQAFAKERPLILTIQPDEG